MVHYVGFPPCFHSAAVIYTVTRGDEECLLRTRARRQVMESRPDFRRGKSYSSPSLTFHPHINAAGYDSTTFLARAIEASRGWHLTQ